MSEYLVLAIRLLVAVLLGAAIGYERELRGKSAGVRTHILVAVGSAFFMIISKYGFADSARFDAARVAAGVVGGLGFLGGGLIVKTKKISGLTTAAGIWVTGALGMAAGSGMMEIAGICAAIVLLAMEALHFYSFRLGDKQVDVVMTSDSEEAVNSALETLGKKVEWFTIGKQKDTFRVDMHLLVKKKEYPMGILATLKSLPGVSLESLE